MSKSSTLLVLTLSMALLAGIWFLLSGEAPRSELASPVPEPAPIAGNVVAQEPSPAPPAMPEALVQTTAPAFMGVVRGRVLHADGRPAADAELRYTWKERASEAPVDVSEFAPATEPAALVSDADGRFTLSALPHGWIGIVATKNDEAGFARALLTPRELEADMVVVLMPGEAIRGVVLNAKGEAVPGATLTPMETDGPPQRDYWREGRAATTDVAGAFEMLAMPPQTWTLRVAAKGYAPLIAEPVPVGTADLRIILKPGVALTGEVIDAKNAPLPDVTVRIAPEDASFEAVEVASDADGRFQFADLSDGAHRVTLNDKQYTLRDGPVDLSLDIRRVPEPLRLVAVGGGGVRGVLLDEGTEVESAA